MKTTKNEAKVKLVFYFIALTTHTHTHIHTTTYNFKCRKAEKKVFIVTLKSLKSPTSGNKHAKRN